MSFSDFFSVEAFLFMIVSMVETIILLSILWTVSKKFVKEDPARSERQRLRILEGIVAGLVCVGVFIIPNLVLKYAFGVDVLGVYRTLFMGFYQTVAVVLFTWASVQLFLMYYDQSCEATLPGNTFEMKPKGEKQIPPPAPAQLKPNLDSPPKSDNNQSGAKERLFPLEKRGLTFMHFICSTIAYYFFLESYLFVMQFDSAQAKATLIPFVLSFIFASVFGALVVKTFMKIKTAHLLVLSCVLISVTSADITRRATLNFVAYYNEFHHTPEEGAVASEFGHLLAMYTSMCYWIVMFTLFCVHFFVKKRSSSLST